MRSIDQKKLALRWKTEGKSYGDISKLLNITRNSAINLCYYKNKVMPKKRGPKFSLTKPQKLSMKRVIGKLKESNQRINSKKLKSECVLNISVRSIQRHMKRVGMLYRKVPSQIILNQKHKEKRVLLINEWISGNHLWEKTIFSDEKRFSLDGPDNWKTYTSQNEKSMRQKRQCSGGSMMVWLMTLPNGLLSFKVITGKFNSEAYMHMLKTSVVPILKLNFGEDFWFQEDNAPVHKSAKVRKFMRDSSIKVLDWPARSPDLNIVEDIWKIISDQVYDGPQFININTLSEKVKYVINDINRSQRQKVLDLYKSIRSRLCTVLFKRGGLYNK